MALETEIKLRVTGIAEFRKKLKQVGARTVARGSGRVHEWNTLYDTDGADLGGRDELLRIRTETPTDGVSAKRRKKRFLLTFKGPANAEGATAKGQMAARDCYGKNHKVREEIELEVGDVIALGTIFARL